MRTLPDALDQLAYHPGTPETAPKFAAMRDKTMAFIEDVWELIPDGPEKTLALRGLQQFLMYSNLAIALTAPADLTNQAVARVLPNTVTREEVEEANPADVRSQVAASFDNGPQAGSLAKAVPCACGATTLAPAERVYREGGKAHRQKPDTCDQ